MMQPKLRLVSSRAVAEPVTIPAPSVRATGTYEPMGDDIFAVDYEHVDARAMEDIKSYQDFLALNFPGWMSRVELTPGDTFSVRLYVFPVNKVMAFLPNHVRTGRR